MKQLVTDMITKGMGATEIWTELMDTHRVSTSLALLQIQIRDTNDGTQTRRHPEASHSNFDDIRFR
ncbi:hypothetical protein ACIQWN_38705 [Streptomyces vinaceus]|uniref:hypothetical protein n=1 Tax=Streptomyces vinaceus TaxID=1960 RepID=UPI00382505FD